MQNKNYIYLVDNKIKFYSKNNDKYYEHVLPSKIIKNGKIINRPKFLREFLKFIKEQKIIKKFSKNILYFIIPPNFEEVDKEILKKVFEDLPFQELKMIKEEKIYHLKKNTLWVNMNQDYTFITYIIKHNRESLFLNNNYLDYNFLEQLKILLSNQSKLKKVYLFGTNPAIIEISKKLETFSNKIVLYFEDHSNYILKEFIRHNLS